MQGIITQAPQTKYYELKDYIRALRRRKWLVLLCVAGVLLPVGLVTKMMTPVYEAEATIIYEEPKDTMFALDVGQAFYNKSAIINMSEFLKSRTIAVEVAQLLPAEYVKLYEFPDPIPPDFSQDKCIAGQLQENLLLEMVPGSDIIKIRIQANDPNAAKFIANAYVERIIAWNLRTKREEISNIRDFVDNQLVVFQEKLNAAEDSLRTFKEENKVISISEASKEILNRMTLAEVSYNQAKTEREALQQRLRFIKKKIREIDPSLTVVASPGTRQLKSRVVELEVQYSANQVNGASETEPQMLALKQEINQAKQQLVHELLKSAQGDNLIDPLSQVRTLLQESITLEVNLETLQAKEEGLQKIITDYDTELQQLPEKELLLARLLRNRDVNDKIYSMLLHKREEARITEAGKVGDVRVVDLAEAPPFPIKPKKKRNLVMGFMLGLGLGVGLAFFLEFFDSSIKSQEDVEKHLNIPVLASIPTIETNGLLHLPKYSQKDGRSYSNKLLMEGGKSSHVSEAYRALQLNFAFVNTDRLIKCILVTSAGPGEGKSLTTVNIAQVFARSGVKTLLVDCDLRRPTIHKILGLRQRPGLTDVLLSENKAVLDWAIQKTEGSQVSVLTSGTLPPNPSELLDTQSMHDLLVTARHEYDLVVLDSPPVIAVTDAMVLGNKADGVCLLIRSGKTSQEAVRKARQLLENSHARIIGIILNDVNFRNVYDYYKDYYYYNEGKKKRNSRKTVKV